MMAARQPELLLNSSMWVVEYGCMRLSQDLNTHLTDVDSAAERRTSKNRRKSEGKFPARLAVHAKDEAKSRKTDRLFVRFLKRNANAHWQLKENPGIVQFACRWGRTVGNALRGVPLGPERHGGRSLQDFGRRKRYPDLNHAKIRY
jgi:hypothetical protein